MQLPWNRKYLEIGFHVIVTILILVALVELLFHLSDAKNVIFQTAGNILAVFSPVLWALIFTLLLEPLVSFWQRFYEKRCSIYHKTRIRNRKAGTAFAYLSAGVLLFLFGSFIAKKIGDTDVRSLAFQVSDYIRKAGDVLVLINLKLAEWGILSNVEGILSFWTEELTAWTEKKILGAANGIPHMGEGVLDILIGLAAAYYFLLEKEQILSFAEGVSSVFFGKKVTGYMRRGLYSVYSVFVGYLSGQVIDAVIMAGLFTLVFLIVGLPHAVLLGLISGFSNLIPYFGAIMAFILALFAGLLSGTPVKALYAAILILLLQQADSIFIVPKVVGKRLELHPVLVLLSLAVFGRIFGFWGLLMAVPLGALCKNLLFWLYERKSN